MHQALVPEKQKISYIYTEVVDRALARNGMTIAETERHVKNGLFAGIVELKDGKRMIPYLVMRTLSGGTSFVSLEEYSIMYLKYLEGDAENCIFVDKKSSDQQQIITRLRGLYHEMREAQAESTLSLINTERYKQVPRDHTNRIKPIDVDSRIIKPASTTGTPARQHLPPVYNTTSYTPPVKKPPEAKPFKRTAPKPRQSTLDKMKDLVVMVMDGKYEPPITKTVADSPEKSYYNHYTGAGNRRARADDYMDGFMD